MSETGTIHFDSGKNRTPDLIFDRISCVDARILALSLIADSQRIKQVRAFLASPSRIYGRFEGVTPQQANTGRILNPSSAFLSQDDAGYSSHVHKIGYGQAHAVFISRRPGFFPTINPEILWKELSGKRFSTPILRSWLPYIEGQIRTLGYLQDCYNFGCKSALLDMTDAQLDAIVSDGIASGMLRIPRSEFVPPENGELPPPIAEIASMDQYLRHYGPTLGRKVVDSLAPLHVPGRDPLPDFRRIIAHNPDREPFAAQQHVIAGGIRMLETQGGGFLGGEQGTGKTLMGSLIVDETLRKSSRKGGCSGRYRALVVCPDHLIAKWGREIRETIPGAIVRDFDDWAEILELSRLGSGHRWKRAAGPEWYILGRNQIKWYPEWGSIAEGERPISRRKFRDSEGSDTIGTQCPECGTIPRSKGGIPLDPEEISKRKRTCQAKYLVPFADPTAPDKIPGDDVIRPNDLASAPMGYQARIMEKFDEKPVGSEIEYRGRQYVVSRCNAPLWQYKGQPWRWPMARYIHKKLRRLFDTVIIDECFPKDTPISTPSGDRMIQDIRPGDIVNSWIDGRIIPGIVDRLIIKRSSNQFVEVSHEFGKIRCTPNHKICTVTRGYVPASELKDSDQLILIENIDEIKSVRTGGNRDHRIKELPDLRREIRRDNEWSESIVLLEEMREHSPRIQDHQTLPILREGIQFQEGPESGILLPIVFDISSMAGSRVEIGHPCGCPGSESSESQGCIRTHEETESRSRISCKRGCCETRQGIRGRQGRKWEDDSSTGSLGQGYGIHYGVSRADGKPTMEMRIDGYRLSVDQIGDRDRRPISQYRDSEESGQDQREDVEQNWMDSSALHKRGDRHESDRDRGGDPRACISLVRSIEWIDLREEFVYDLEIRNTHCYFANSALVSNCHEMKSDEAAQSMAVGKLIASTRHSLAMTGTLIGGYASHLYPLLYRIAGRSLRAEGFEWGKDLAFSEAYGRVDRIVTTKETIEFTTDKSASSMRKTAVGKSTERKAVRPGIMPTLFGRHLLPCSVFITLDEMAANLPRFAEYIGGMGATHDRCHFDTVCDMAPAQESEYRRVESALKSANTDLLRVGSQKLLGAYLWTLLDYPDRPYGWRHAPDFMNRFRAYRHEVARVHGMKTARALTVPHSVGYWQEPDNREIPNWVGVVTPADLPADVVYPKERKLIDIVKSQYDMGIQTWIYVQMTNKRDIQPRLAALLASEGIRAGILRSGDVKPRDREAWIAKNGPKYDVIISHPQLVCTGLELFAARHNYSSIVFYQCGYNPFIMGQAARRAWRIGQRRDCRVYYLYYRDTMAHKAIKLMSLKAAASRSLEGRLSMEGLSAMSGDVSIQMALAKGIADNISDRDMLRNWGKVQSGPAEISRLNPAATMIMTREFEEID